MKKRNLFLVLLVAFFSTAAFTSCKSKKTEPTIQQQDKTTNAPVEISSDDKLRQSVNDVLKGYNGVEAEIKDGVVTLKGNIKQIDLQGLVMKLNELRPKKVETDKLVIKT
jgi:biopolymer transport protein ExbD